VYESSNPCLEVQLMTLMPDIGVGPVTRPLSEHAGTQNSCLSLLLVLHRHEIHHRFQDFPLIVA